MADIVKALLLLVVIGPDRVRVPATAPKKNGHWAVPLHKVCPNSPKSLVEDHPKLEVELSL